MNGLERRPGCNLLGVAGLALREISYRQLQRKARKDELLKDAFEVLPELIAPFISDIQGEDQGMLLVRDEGGQSGRRWEREVTGRLVSGGIEIVCRSNKYFPPAYRCSNQSRFERTMATLFLDKGGERIVGLDVVERSAVLIGSRFGGYGPIDTNESDEVWLRREEDGVEGKEVKRETDPYDLGGSLNGLVKSLKRESRSKLDGEKNDGVEN
jgi:hypothetical protein